jgi:hypothetical protein
MNIQNLRNSYKSLILTYISVQLFLKYSLKCIRTKFFFSITVKHLNRYSMITKMHLSIENNNKYSFIQSIIYQF